MLNELKTSRCQRIRFGMGVLLTVKVNIPTRKCTPLLDLTFFFSSGSEVTPACQNKLSNYCYFPLSVECHASLRELIFVLSVMGGADEDTCKPFFYQF